VTLACGAARPAPGHGSGHWWRSAPKGQGRRRRLGKGGKEAGGVPAVISGLDRRGLVAGCQRWRFI
jgi:hypothetical protein